MDFENQFNLKPYRKTCTDKWDESPGACGLLYQVETRNHFITYNDRNILQIKYCVENINKSSEEESQTFIIIFGLQAQRKFHIMEDQYPPIYLSY